MLFFFYFWRNIYSSPLSILKITLLRLFLSFRTSPCVLDTNAWYDLKILSPYILICGLSFHSVDSVLSWTKLFNVDKIQLIYFSFFYFCFYSSAGYGSACSAGDPGSIPGSGRPPGEGIGYPLQYSWASLVAQMVKDPPVIWEAWVQFLDWGNPLEVTTLCGNPLQYSCLENPHGQRILLGYSPWGCKELDTTEGLSRRLVSYPRNHYQIQCHETLILVLLLRVLWL